MFTSSPLPVASDQVVPRSLTLPAAPSPSTSRTLLARSSAHDSNVAGNAYVLLAVHDVRDVRVIRGVEDIRDARDVRGLEDVHHVRDR